MNRHAKYLGHLAENL